MTGVADSLYSAGTGGYLHSAEPACLAVVQPVSVFPAAESVVMPTNFSAILQTSEPLAVLFALTESQLLPVAASSAHF